MSHTFGSRTYVHCMLFLFNIFFLALHQMYKQQNVDCTENRTSSGFDPCKVHCGAYIGMSTSEVCFKRTILAHLPQCTSVEVCDPHRKYCIPGKPLCNDGKLCTKDVCNLITGGFTLTPLTPNTCPQQGESCDVYNGSTFIRWFVFIKNLSRENKMWRDAVLPHQQTSTILSFMTCFYFALKDKIKSSFKKEKSRENSTIEIISTLYHI